MASIVFGIDISHHQDINLSLERARRENGVEFVFIKSTEGSTFVDPEFTSNLAEALRVGQYPAAYHYVRGNASATAQVENVRRVVPKDVPVIPDVEAGSGGVPLVRELIDKLRQAGFRVPLLYLPRWYWQQLGSPSLAGLPPLWSSRYPDTIVGTIPEEWDDVPSTYWNGYGGLDVKVLQFTSSARVAGHAPIDANGFRGTREDLARFLGYAPSATTPAPVIEEPIQEEDGMKIYYAKGNSTTKMPAPHQTVAYGDLVFLIEATADGLKRRHIQNDELSAATAAGAKVATVSHAWLDGIPCPLGLFPWENTGGPVSGDPQ